MAFNQAPTALFPNYSFDGTSITIPISDITGLTADEANATLGDWRSIVLSLCATVYSHYADLAEADRPVAFKANPPTQYPVSTGSLAGTFRQTYSFEFYNVFAMPDVADEPT